MIYNKSIKQSKTIIENKIKSGHTDYDRQDWSISNCQCSINGAHGIRAGFIAFPSDSTKILLGCADCLVIHYVGE